MRKDLLNAQKLGAGGYTGGLRSGAEANRQSRKKPGLPALPKNAGTAAEAPAVKQTGTYYSPRQFGGQEKIYGHKAQLAKSAVEEQQKAFREAQRALEQLNAQVEEKRKRYYELTGTFEGDTAQQYEDRIAAEWTEAVDLYVEGRQNWQKAYDAYKPYEDAYNKAVAEYNDYVRGEQEAYAGWRNTIRPAEEIRAEQKGLKEKRAELQRRMQMANDIAAGTAAPGIQAQAAQNEAAIRELQEYLGGVGDREKLLAEELGWSEHFRYEDLRKNGDFAEKSAYRAGRFADADKDYMYTWVNQNGGKPRDYEMTGNEDWHVERTRYMTQDEIGLYNYVHATQGPDASAEYLRRLDPELERRATGEAVDDAVAFGREHPLWAGVQAAVMSPFVGAATVPGQLIAAASGEEIDPDARSNSFANVKNALREGATATVEERWGPAGTFAYQTGMSMLDMVADRLVGGPAARALIGSRAFSETVIDAKRRGVSNSEALSLGSTSALAEALTEQIGVDEMLRLPKEWKNAGFWKGLLKGAGGEAIEEGVTNVINLAADLIIAGDKSEFMQTVEGYKAGGMDGRKALLKALGDAGISLLADAAGGAISGGVFGGVDGWRGKRAADTQQKRENAANTAAAEKPDGGEYKGFVDDGEESVRSDEAVADRSVQVPREGRDGTGAVPYERNAAPDNGTTVPNNGTTAPNNGTTVPDNGTEPVAGGAARAGSGNVQKAADRAAGTGTPDIRTEASPGSLKEVVLNSVNPLMTRVMHTPLTRDIENRVSRAETDMEVMEATAAAYGVDSKRLEQVRVAMELTGITRVVFDSGKRQNGKRVAGRFDRETRVIHLNPEASSPQLVVYGHEMTHRIEQTDGYDAFSRLVLDRMEDTGANLKQLREDRKAEYAQGGRQLADEDIDREIVAQYAAENLLSNEADIRALVNRNRTLGQRIRSWIDGWLAKFGNGKAKERQFLERARDLYVQALNESDRFDEQYVRSREREELLDRGEVDEEEAEYLRQLDEEDLGGDGDEMLREGMDLMLEDDAGGRPAQNRPKKKAPTVQNMRSMKIDRTFLDYGDEKVLNTAVESALDQLVHKGKITVIHTEDIAKHEAATDWNSRSSARKYLKVLLQRFTKETVYLTHNGQYAEAYLTTRGVGHTVGGDNTPHKAAQLSTFSDLIKNAEYAFSCEHDDHSGGSGRINGAIDWDYFVAAASVDGHVYPVLFTVRTIDSDVRSQIYEIYTKKETDVSHGGGRQEGPDAHPIYGVASISESIVNESTTAVKGERGYNGRIKAENVQYALEDTISEEGTDIPAAAKSSDFVPKMPMQVQRSLKAARNELVRTVGKALGISSENRNGTLKQTAENLNNEYIATGVTSQESIESFWDHAVSLATKEPTEAVRAEFDEAIRKLERTQERATRYLNELYDTEVPEDGAEEESRTPPPPEPEKELTEEEAGALMKQCKQAKSRASRISRMAMLRESDKEKIRLLLRGEIQTNELDPETDNVEDILEVYEAKKEYEELAKQARQYKRQKGKSRRETADRMTRTALNWKDKKGGFWYSRETMERNIRDIVDSKRLAREIIETYFTPVHKAEAAKLRFKKELRARVEGLNISTKVTNGNTHSESYAVQFLGETLSHIQILKKSGNISARREGKTLREWEAEVAEFRRQNPNLDETSIKAKIQEFRKIYDELLDQVNTVRIRNGYEPVNRIEGYFPHFQMMEYTGFWGGVKKAMGFRADITPLPTTINGRTAGFKPGIRWMANAQERKGFQTTYDAIEGFERYLNSAADVIYLTDCIQNLRAFAESIRYNASDEGLRKQVDRINADPSQDEEQRRAAIERVYKEGKFTASQFVTELDEYTNLLAGKRSAGDREMERLFGRGAYNVAKWAEQKTGANMVAANIGSALTNFIPMTQGFAVLENRHFFHGMADTLRGEWKRDGFRGSSTFLTNRMGDSRISRTAMEKASEAAGWFMEWIDMLSAETITRGRYYQNLSRGMSELAAMDEADAWAAGLMGDRSKGGMPTIFEQTNPVAKLFTQFQLEVNNQFGFMFKDIPKDFEDEVIKNIAAFLLKWLLGQYLFNDLYERFVGRRPAFDAMNLVNEFVGDMTGYELPNTFEAISALMKGEPVNFETEKEGAGGALKNFAVNVAEELPFTSAANLIGIEIDGGRVPVASAIPDLSVVGDVIGNPDWSWEKRWKELGEEAAKPLTYLLPPFGGGQAKKAVEAVGNYWNKGRYTMDADGNLLLQFPMSSVPEAIQAALFGSTSTDAGQTWVEGGFKNLNAKQTQAYKSLTDDGMSGEKAYEAIAALRHAEKTEEASRTQVQRQILLGLDLTDQQKHTVYRALITEEREDDIAKFREAGMDMDDFLAAQIRHADIKVQYEDEGDMATAFARWVNDQSWDKEQKATVRECFKYWNMTPANSDRYDKALEAGLDDETAFELTEELKDLGKNPKEVQKWRVAIDDSWNEEGQLQRLKAVGMNDAAYAKCEAAWNEGIAPAAYVRAQEIKDQFDSDGNGSLTNDDWRNLVNSLAPSGIALPGDKEHFNLTNEQMGFLWQMLSGRTSAKNNPFSPAGGEKWLAIKEQMKEDKEE